MPLRTLQVRVHSSLWADFCNEEVQVSLRGAPAMLRGSERERRGARDARIVEARGAVPQYGYEAAGGEEAQFPLHTFRRGDLVLARNVNRSERYWPVCPRCTGKHDMFLRHKGRSHVAVLSGRQIYFLCKRCREIVFYFFGSTGTLCKLCMQLPATTPG